MKVNVTVDDAKVVARMTRAPQAIQRRVVKNATKVGVGLVNYIKQERLSGQDLQVRTGTGRRSIFYRVDTNPNDVVVYVGADLRKAKYMRIHEYGGTVTPTRSRYLTIPVGRALTAKGVARFSARQVIANPEAFGYVGTFFAKKMLFGKKDDGSFEPLFVLRESVTLKPVGYLVRTLDEKGQWARVELTYGLVEAVNGNG